MSKSTPPNLVRSRRLLIVFALLVPVLVAVFKLLPPTRFRLTPPCLFYTITGWHCVGCGGTRSVGALVNGDIEQAFAFNALFILASPFLAWFAYRVVRSMWTGHPILGSHDRPWAPGWGFWTVFSVMIAFTIIRNLPWEPFTRLVPRELARAAEGERADGGLAEADANDDPVAP